MNLTVARLTARNLVGKRRSLLLLALPAVLIALAVLIRSLGGDSEQAAVDLVWAFGFATLLPLLGLIAGTGAIAPEIGDGSIVYILAKPIRRSSVLLSKFAVAAAIVLVFGAVPVFVTAVILAGEAGDVATALAAGAAAAAVAYAAIFLWLGVVTRNSVVIGLLYALVWEGIIGSIVPGAQALSVQQWSFSITEGLLGEDRAGDLGLEPAVSTTTGTVLLVLTVIVVLTLATRRLRRVGIATGED